MPVPSLPSRRRPALPLARAWCLLAALAFSTSGCDLFDPGGPSYAGVVVDAETGEPIEGIPVSLQVSGSFAGYSIVAEDLTDVEGRFWLRDPLDRGSRSILFANSLPYMGDQPSYHNPSYGGGNVNFDFNDRHNIRIELSRL